MDKGESNGEKKTIYFFCTGNSCRSQMAEGWAKKYLSDLRMFAASIGGLTIRQRPKELKKRSGLYSNAFGIKLVNAFKNSLKPASKIEISKPGVF